MGQKQKQIKDIAVGLLLQKHMTDLLIEMEKVTEPRMLAFLKDNFKPFVMQRLNVSLDLADKKKIGGKEDMDNVDEAMKLANEAYEKYITAKQIKQKEKEDKKNMGEELTPV